MLILWLLFSFSILLWRLQIFSVDGTIKRWNVFVQAIHDIILRFFICLHRYFYKDDWKYNLYLLQQKYKNMLFLIILKFHSFIIKLEFLKVIDLIRKQYQNIFEYDIFDGDIIKIMVSKPKVPYLYQDQIWRVWLFCFYLSKVLSSPSFIELFISEEIMLFLHSKFYWFVPILFDRA